MTAHGMSCYRVGCEVGAVWDVHLHDTAEAIPSCPEHLRDMSHAIGFDHVTDIYHTAPPADHPWSAAERDNATLIAECATLGYLKDSWLTLDPTYGYGVFWRQWRPLHLLAHDLNPAKAPAGVEDFTALSYPDEFFDAVVFDPPYKLNGTPSEPDEAYGVDVPARWQDRMALCERGIVECARVLKPSGPKGSPGGYLLIKCMDQVVSAKRRFQARRFAEVAEANGCVLVDELHNVRAPRAQPEGRRQVHALASFSTLLVLRKRPTSGRGSRKV